MNEVKKGVHISTEEENYILDPMIKDQLENFKDQKLGFMTHFGIFSQLGIVESWGLSDEIAEDRWSQDGLDWTDIATFKKQYFNLNKSFNPVCLEPSNIVKFLKSCGFNYFIIPTKHHDGFCLWDTKVSDYKIGGDCPYQEDIYNSFRKACFENKMMIGSYFSKADFSNDDYWEKSKLDGDLDRHPTYDTAKGEKWENFKKFTHAQIDEITSKQYPVDILWLDAGWVKKERNQDIDIDKIAEISRKNNKNTIVVDRSCGGIHENYITPEQTLFDHYVDVCWESCISLGDGFAYTFNDDYKDEYDLAHLFTEIISKGGNLVLNVAFEPSGKFPIKAMIILSKFSKWYQQYQDIIVGSRAVYPYYNGYGHIINNGCKYLFIKNKKDSVIKKHIFIEDQKMSKMVLLYEGKMYQLEFENMNKRIKIRLPDEIIMHLAPLCYVVCYEEE